jgi:hypothetical protein
VSVEVEDRLLCAAGVLAERIASSGPEDERRLPAATAKELADGARVLVDAACALRSWRVPAGDESEEGGF